MAEIAYSSAIAVIFFMAYPLLRELFGKVPVSARYHSIILNTQRGRGNRTILTPREQSLLPVLNPLFDCRYAGQPHALRDGSLIRAMSGDCARIHRARGRQQMQQIIRLRIVVLLVAGATVRVRGADLQQLRETFRPAPRVRRLE